MRTSLPAAIVGLAIVPFACAAASGNIVTDIADAYDFVIVGGGLAGLVLGSRLSEDANHTVLVLESGDTGDSLRQRIDTPADAYFDSLLNTDLNWNFTTVAQPNVNDREIGWPRGKVLGGSSAVNGLYMTRPGEIEVNAWRDMLGDMDGADNWAWKSFFDAIRTSETFSPPIDSVVQEAGITWDESSHGMAGPINVSYPGYSFPEVGKFLLSSQNAGVAISNDMYGGQNWGAMVSASTIDPLTWKRSYSRSGYLDSLPGRANYDVLANAHVTRVVFDTSSLKNLTANAVEYTRDNGATKKTVKVKKEVILAGGSIGSPAVLMHSGVGPKDVLSSAGVDLVHELPGVGQHLQDHLSATVKWKTDQQTAGSIYYDNGADKNDQKFLSYIDDAVAYVNSTVLYGNSVSQTQKTILSQMDQYTPKTSSDETVISGYEAIYNKTASELFTSLLGQIELLFMNSDGYNLVGVTAAIQRPYSHGAITINSSDPMTAPVIDPNYLNHPADVQTLREGLKLARRVGEASPLKDILKDEQSPGTQVQSDADWEEWLRNNTGTEYHPSSTCAMLPLEQGGVVDANLRVYGLANVRVADASVPPFVFSSHLMSSTYGLAEQASVMIRNTYRAVPQKSTNGTTASTTGTGGKGGSSPNGSDSGNKNGALMSSRPSIPLLILALYTALQILI